MRKPALRKRQARPRAITSADVGRYLKSLASLNRDAHIGNPPLADALQRLATILIEGKSLAPEIALDRAIEQGTLDFSEDPDFEEISLDEVKKILSDSDIPKAYLLILAAERLGMARSRLEKMPKEDILRSLWAAVQHEESLAIISEEAKRGGQVRAS